MDSNQGKEERLNQSISMRELGELFLESKYDKIALKSYGTCKQRIGIINEFFADKMISDITKIDLINFEMYLRKERKWNNVDKPSEHSIKSVICVLKELLNKAIFWNLIEKIPDKKLDNNYNINTTKVKNIKKIKGIRDILIENEKKMLSRKMDSILNG